MVDAPVSAGRPISSSRPASLPMTFDDAGVPACGAKEISQSSCQ